MKKKIRKGFTLVELVVVIAVIAVLSGVSVGTYVSVTNNAKKSVDQQSVAQMNTCLALHEATQGGSKPETMYQALNILKDELGTSSLDKFLINSFSGYAYAWDISTNRFVILEGDNIAYSDGSYPSNRSYLGHEEDFWRIVEQVDSNALYSQYLFETSNEVSGQVTIKSGFDVGDNQNISTINYVGEGPECKNVIIRTNSDSLALNVTAFVNGSNCDTIKHYGFSGSINVINGGMNSYHEFGEIENNFIINAGHAVIEQSANIKSNKVVVVSNGVDKIKIDYRNANKKYNFVDADDNAIFISNDPQTLISGAIINDNNQKIDLIEVCTHSFIDNVTLPSCEEKGYTTHTCEKCGYSYADNYTNPLGHNYLFNEIVWDQNSYEAKAIYKCSHNDLHIEEHNCLIDIYVSKQPTCKQTGIKVYKASYDNHTSQKEEVIPVVPENHTLQHYDGKNPTCTEAGWESYYACSECEYTTYKEIPALGHDYPNELIEKVEPTCTEKGYTLHKCSRCDYSYKDNFVDAIGHKYGKAVSNNNKTHTYNCIHGDNSYNENCTFGEPIVTNATCTEKGTKKYTCTECGYVYFEEIPALGHDVSSEWTIDIDSTCISVGSKSHHCKRCGEKLDITVVPVKEHNYSDVVYTWNSNNTQCIAERHCLTSGCTHIESESGNITSTITQERTNLLPEITTYVATFKNECFKTQNKVVETAGKIVPNVVNCTYNQMNEKAKNFLKDVTYDPNDTTTSLISSYNTSPYTGDEPVSGKVNLVAGNLTVTDGETNISYTEKVNAGEYNFYNLTPNVDSSYVVKDSNGNTLQQGTLHPTGQLRMIKFSDTTFNIRDIGGWNCDGGTLNYNKIIRGSQVDNSHGYPSTGFTDAEFNRYLKILNIKDEIDLRVFGGDYGPVPTISYFGSNVDYHQFTAVAYYQGIAQSNAGYNETWRSIVSLIATDLSQDKPIYLHCSEGADRTGTIMFLLEAICGVSESDLDKDYELTTLRSGPAGQRVRTYESYLNMKQYLKKFYGDTLQDKVVNYMLAIGVTMDEINTIRDALINSNSSTAIEQHNFFDKNTVLHADYVATHVDTVDCRNVEIIRGRVSTGSHYIDAGGYKSGTNHTQIISKLIPCSPGDKVIVSSNYPIKDSVLGVERSGCIYLFANDCSDESLKKWAPSSSGTVYTMATGAPGCIAIPGLDWDTTKYVEYTIPTNYSDVKSFRVTIALNGSTFDDEDIKIYVIQKGIKS